MKLTVNEFNDIERYGEKLLQIDYPISNKRELIYRYNKKIYHFNKINDKYYSLFNNVLLTCNVYRNSISKKLKEYLEQNTNSIIHKYYYI